MTPLEALEVARVREWEDEQELAARAALLAVERGRARPARVKRYAGIVLCEARGHVGGRFRPCEQCKADIEEASF